jgi:tetratricopeptide (TPR) repeat protein
MRRLPALLAALLLPAAQPLLLATVISGGALLVAQAPAQAESAEAVAKVAEAITVRIEGATQGSGVLVKRDGNRYTILTAWHVVAGQRPGEELDIFTPEGQKHKLEQGSIKHLGDVDMAVLSFSSPNSYAVAKVGDIKSVISSDQVSVAGFPIGSNGLIKIETGRVVANASVSIDEGYQLLYSVDTVAGMSGGVVLNADGTLIGMHGRGELDEVKSRQLVAIIKTGDNQGIPISYYSLFEAGAPIVAASTKATTADDYLALARQLMRKKGSDQEIIRLSNQALSKRQSQLAYYYRAYARYRLNDYQGAIGDLDRAIDISPRSSGNYNARGLAKAAVGDLQGSMSDFSQAIIFNPQSSEAYINRGASKSRLNDHEGAIADYKQAIAISPLVPRAYNNLGIARHALGDDKQAVQNYSFAIDIEPSYSEAYHNRGFAKFKLGDSQGAILDYTKAISINPQDASPYGARGFAKAQMGDRQGACEDLRISSTLGSPLAKSLFPKICQ